MNRKIVSKKRQTTIGSVLLLAVGLLVGSSASAFPVRLGVGPDNNYTTLSSIIDEAQESIRLNIYHYTNARITSQLIQKIEDGVCVQMLVEAEPLHQDLPVDSKKLLALIVKAMRADGRACNKLFLMVTPEHGERRFVMDHAKYIVADESKAWISSENISDSGHTLPGNVGNRGWDVVIENSRLAGELTAIFKADTDLRNKDIREVKQIRMGALPSEPRRAQADRAKRTIPAIAEAMGNATRGTLVTSPDSLDELKRLIRSATQHLELEYLSLSTNWKDEGKASLMNPIISELIKAAQRGVEVRVLLNDPATFSGGTSAPSNDPEDLKGNDKTVNLLQTIAKQEGLPLEARIVDYKALQISYVHNKGILVDGKTTLISSINGTQNSIMRNRETAVILSGTEIAEYYGAVFDFDWRASSRQRPVLGAQPRNLLQEALASPGLF